MNIWIFNHYALPPDLPGGTRHFDLARELVQRGHQVVIVASSFHHHLHRHVRLSPDESWVIEVIDGVKFVWLRTFPYQRNDWRRVLSMLDYMVRSWWMGRRFLSLDSELGKPDVIVGSSVHPFAVLAAYQVAKHYHATFVMEVRDLWPQTLIDMGSLREGSFTTRFFHTLENFLYQRADLIITLLPLAYEYIVSRGVAKDKVVWIPNGVDLGRFQRMDVQDTLFDSFRVVYLGAHGQANALDTILLAAKIIQEQQNSDIEFILVGDGPEKPWLIGLAAELELENIQFRDPVPKTVVPTVLSEANAFIFSLGIADVFKYGISSNKLFDYMMMGRPVVFAADAANNPIEEAQCGYSVPPMDPQALAAAIVELSQLSSGERTAMGLRGREYVERNHSFSHLASLFEEAISDAGSFSAYVANT